MGVKVGDTVWVFDKNRRVYPPRVVGDGGFRFPIWREHWQPLKVVGETSRSWLLDGWDKLKVPKVNADPRRFAFSQAEIDEQAWLHENHYRIISKIQYSSDTQLFREIAALIGYKETP
jgi:hypothetical protein